MTKKDMYDFLEKNSSQFNKLSDDIWNYAETSFEEFRSAKRIIEELKSLGFTVEETVKNVPNAFVATWGSGYPTIGFLGEYDALPSLAQEAGATSHSPTSNQNGNGHGCGHNMLGTGALMAATALKEYLSANGKSGTVKYFGCPGEEGGSGKAFMAREGVFEGLDLAFTWHPMNFNAVFDSSTLANYQVSYEFTGRSAHAAAAPQYGRSALDAVELMNVGVQYLREHIIQEARVHYAITDTGGFSPNVVQANAKVLYLIRAPKISQVEEIYQRINKIAKGMAMATETEVHINFIKSCADIVPNKILSDRIYSNLKDAPKIQYTKEEYDFATAIDNTITNAPNLIAMANITADDANQSNTQMQGKALYEDILPFYIDKVAPTSPGSTDVGDVSYFVPTGQVVTTCWTYKTSPHTWQVVSVGKSGIAYKGMMFAAQVMAGAAIDAIEDDDIIQNAKKELAGRVANNPYKCAIPKDVMPKPTSAL